MTRRDLVLDCLQQARRHGRITFGPMTVDTPGGWVPGWVLTTPHTGGSEGLRRARELRDAGHPVERRQIRGQDGYEYRLPPLPVPAPRVEDEALTLVSVTPSVRRYGAED